MLRINIISCYYYHHYYCYYYNILRTPQSTYVLLLLARVCYGIFVIFIHVSEAIHLSYDAIYGCACGDNVAQLILLSS